MLGQGLAADTRRREVLRGTGLAQPPELAELREATRGFIDAFAPPSQVRALAEAGAGVDRQVWRRACLEQGWAALAVSESEGGAGLGFEALAGLTQECG